MNTTDTEAPARRHRLALVAIAALVVLLSASPLWSKLLSQEGFLPQETLSWGPALRNLHLVSGLLIAAAYLSIALTITYFVRRREDLPFNWVFVLFAAFIVAGGVTHLIEIGTLWYPFYWSSGTAKAMTALISAAAAVALVWLMPQLLALPSNAQLQEATDRMKSEMDERRAAEVNLRTAHAALETRITERTAELAAANQLLTRQREWLQVILSSIAEAVLAADDQGRVVFLNPVAERLTGWRDADAQGKPLDQVWRVREAETGRPRPSFASRVMASRSVQRIAAARVRVGLDATDRVLEKTGVPLIGEDQRLKGIVLFVRDLTSAEDASRARQQLQSSLAAANALLDTLFDAAPVGLGFWDLQLRYVRVNRALAAMNGLSVEEHLGKTVPELLPSLGRQVNVLLRTVIDAGHAVREVELVGETPAQPGVVRWWRASFYPVHAGENLIGIGAVCDEITLAKRIESERGRLLAAEREARVAAERASILKDEFLATVSHELRNPLNSILGWTHMLESGRLSTADQGKAVETIARNARAQARLVEDLLDFSRLGSGRLRLDIKRIDPARSIEAACDMFRTAARSKSLRLNCELEKAAFLVAADPDRLQQIVSNLLSNAIKFTHANGQIDVTLRRVESMMEIAVADTGAGIPPEFLPHVFEPFRLADAGTTRQHQGLGLGLAIVKSLVELHGGTVAAFSDGLGKGTRVVVRLPIAAFVAEDSEAGQAAVAQSALRGLSVLVVDDQADAREALRKALLGYGAEVVLADSATAAVAALDTAHVDVLVSDIGMPYEDGIALIGRLRADSRRRDLPAIALTAHGREEDKARALAAGYQRHLTKPAELDALVQSIAELARVN
jgi:PAS domain S-box-containing protein